METYESRPRRAGKARRRHLVRRRQHQKKAHAKRVQAGPEAAPLLGMMRWRAAHNPAVLKVSGAVGITILGLFVATYLLTDRIFPNVWSLSMPIGGMSVEEAEARLLGGWQNQARIQLVDGDRVWTATPTEIGLRLDARNTAEAARGLGMAGIPLGYSVEPVVGVDSETAESYLTTLADQVNIAPYNAGYEWQGERLVGVRGREGRRLDIAGTAARLAQNPTTVASLQRLDLLTLPVQPDAADPMFYFEDANRLASQPFVLNGYDLFADQTVTWTTTREVFTSWLQTGASGLTLRTEALLPFVEALNATLNTGEAVRHLNPDETADAVRQAISSKQSSAALRIRYHPTTYTVVPGDTGFRIARKTGIPFFLIQEANPGFDLSVLSPGNQLNLPSRDVTVPLKPVANKRIIVNLDTQWLVAYENGQPVFSWAISSGIPEAPTSPGVFQILSHEPVAYGSSYGLCDSTGCGQWELQWFMGIYEVIPGLVNGFHGAVLLPDGTYLGGNIVGRPYTLGCVMSRNDEAKRLYDWADEGTIVEIISSEFQPQSELGRAAPP